MPDGTKIGIRLKRLRVDRGLKLSELSLATGISKTSLSAYEKGIRIPSDANKKILADYYSFRVEELFY